MSCSNCYNGCTEIVSDQCVKYTGIDVPILGIKTGDSLSYVEQTLIGFLVSTLNGTGIKLDINPQIICEIVNKNLVACEDLTLPNVINALIRAVCELDTRVTALEDDFAALEGPYTVGCLDGVTSTSGTHAILQAVITKLCAHIADFDAFVIDVETNYVKKSELCALVAACTPSSPTTSYKDRMVPFTVVEYYGSLTGNFDVSGAGIGAFDKIYLCNGNNGTPDKRGRVPVGTTIGMGGGPLNPAVDPAVAGNPSYALLGTQGANSIVLTPAQIAAHSHSATATVTDPGHTHTLAYAPGFSDPDEPGAVADYMDQDGTKSSSTTTNTAVTGVSVAVSVGSAGGGLGHPNFQPGLGCYYIMYIP